MRRAARLLAVLTVLLAAVTAASAGPATAEAPPGYFVDETKLPFAALPGIDTDRYWGVHERGGLSDRGPAQLEPPARHVGTRFPRLPASSSRWTTIRCGRSCIANGYAWAASSYSRNEYDVEAGVKDTHALDAALQRNRRAARARVYLTGASMGGHVTAAAIEQYPDEYDGAMPICGVLGDHELFDFYLDYNLVAAALAGVTYDLPAGPGRLDDRRSAADHEHPGGAPGPTL